MASLPPPEWLVTTVPLPYATALARMEERVAAISEGRAPELVWLLEHTPVITGGIQAAPEDMLQPGRFPVYATGRGGRYTYHGPGQRVLYVLLDLRRRHQSLRHFIAMLENWVLASLRDFGVEAFLSEAGVGIWVKKGASQAKIAALGVRVRHGVTFHGVAVNVTTDLTDFRVIVPCGIRGYGVARLADLIEGGSAEEGILARFDAALARHFPDFLAALAPGNANLAEKPS